VVWQGKVTPTGGRLPRLRVPPSATPAPRALVSALNTAADIASGGTTPRSGDPGRGVWPREHRGLRAVADAGREGIASMFAIRLMLCTGVAAIFLEVLPLQRSYWVILAVAIVLKPDFGSVFTRALQYGAGTVIGVAAAALILVAQPPQPDVVASLVASAALMPYAMSRTYSYVGVALTPLVALMISPGGWHLAEDRLIDILLGCGIALRQAARYLE
jgi:uncharacterized membrane protein YccC